MNLSRRQFMAAGAAAATTAWLGSSRLLAQSDAHQASIEKYSGFKMGLQTYSLRHFNFEDTVNHMADLDLHWAEFYPGNQYGITQDEQEIARRKSLLDEHNIALYHYGVVGFGGDAQANRNIFEFGKKAGIKVFSANPSPESFPILHDLVQEYDIKVCIHNHGPGARYETVEDSLEAVADFDERIGFGPDTGHYMRAGIDPIEAVEKSRDRLHGMHLKDHAAIRRGDNPETILGEGVIDLKALTSLLREIGFMGPLSLEYELNAQDPIDDIRKGLNNFAEAARETA